MARLTAARSGIKVSGGPPGADRVKAEHRGGACELQKTGVEQLAHLAAMHLGVKMHRVRFGGNLIGQDEVSAHFHQYVTLPADHCELPAPLYGVLNGDAVSTGAAGNAAGSSETSTTDSCCVSTTSAPFLLR